MSVSNKIPNISFTSRIEFVSEDEFKNRTKQVEKVGMTEEIGSAKIVSEGCTTDASLCTVGGFHNAKIKPSAEREALMFHLYHGYTLGKFYKVEAKFEEAKTHLLREEEPEEQLSGLICGAKFSNGESKELNEKIKELFMELEVKASIICDQRPFAKTDIAYSAEDDIWTIVSDKNISGVKTLKAAYSDISIAVGDRLFINGEEVKKEEHPELFASEEKAEAANVSD